MIETLKQKLFRALIASTVALCGGGAILFYGYRHYQTVQQYWIIPAAIMIGYVLFKDIQIIKGRN